MLFACRCARLRGSLPGGGIKRRNADAKMRHLPLRGGRKADLRTGSKRGCRLHGFYRCRGRGRAACPRASPRPHWGPFGAQPQPAWNRHRNGLDTVCGARWAPQTWWRCLTPVRSRLGRIAQLVEQLTLNQRVQGSSPCAPTNPPRRVRRFEPHVIAPLPARLGAFICARANPKMLPANVKALHREWVAASRN